MRDELDEIMEAEAYLQDDGQPEGGDITEYTYADTTGNKILDLIKGFTFGITKEGLQMTISTDQVGMLVYWTKELMGKLARSESSERACAERMNEVEDELRRVDPENKVLGDVTDVDDFDS